MTRPLEIRAHRKLGWKFAISHRPVKLTTSKVTIAINATPKGFTMVVERTVAPVKRFAEERATTVDEALAKIGVLLVDHGDPPGRL